MPLEDIRSERLRKSETLRERGIDPYPADSGRTHLIAEALKKFSAIAKSKKRITIAGRVIAKREHGGATFFDLRDAGGQMQALAKEDVLGEPRNTTLTTSVLPPKAAVKVDIRGEQYKLFLDTVDIGDFVQVSGTVFLTKKEEKTIEVGEWIMLAKSLRPLPEKWHGLQDVEERFRKRYLDLLMNEGVRERFEVRAKIIKVIRDFHEAHGFLEVETPMLHPIPGGALARPFATHHNALDIDLYLRVAPELYLKRLLVGGYERVFEIGKCFRNEGIDVSHNPEFTMLECYAAYWNENDMMGFVEDLFIALAKEFNKKGEIASEGKTIAFKKPFTRITFNDLLARYALISDYDGETRDSIATRAKQFGIDVSPHESKSKIADEVYKKICRPYLVQPTFVINHPLELSPLAKKRQENLEEVRRFQLIAGGVELTNGFSELNDPVDQKERFLAQEKEREQGEEEAMHIDEDYVEALEYGMPPAAGLGIGIDRVVMLFTDTRNIREVVLFPTLRPK